MKRNQIGELIRLFNPQFEEKRGNRLKTKAEMEPIFFRFLQEI